MQRYNFFSTYKKFNPYIFFLSDGFSCREKIENKISLQRHTKRLLGKNLFSFVNNYFREAVEKSPENVQDKKNRLCEAYPLSGGKGKKTRYIHINFFEFTEKPYRFSEASNFTYVFFYRFYLIPCST